MTQDLNQWASQPSQNGQTQQPQPPQSQQQSVTQQYPPQGYYYAQSAYQPRPRKPVDLDKVKAWSSAISTALVLVLLGAILGVVYERTNTTSQLLLRMEQFYGRQR